MPERSLKWDLSGTVRERAPRKLLPFLLAIVSDFPLGSCLFHSQAMRARARALDAGLLQVPVTGLEDGHVTSQSQWEAMRPHTIGKIAPSLCNGTRGGGEVRSGGAVGTLCLSGNGSQYAGEQSQRRGRSKSPWSSATLDHWYMNQYILFLLKPLRIWCFVPSTRGALTYLSIQGQKTHHPTATGMMLRAHV